MDPYPLAAFTVLKPIHAPLSRYRMKDVDAHSHVDRYDLVDEQARGSALTEITQHDILTVSNSMDLPCYKQNLEISEMFNLALPTFGVHPWNALDYADRPDDLREGVGATPMLGET